MAARILKKNKAPTKAKWVTVNDRMQKQYRYQLTAPMGRNFDPEFKPQLTPKEMLELGVFCGKYMTNCRKKFPASWFTQAKLSPKGRDCSLNYFGVDASRPLSNGAKRLDPSRRSARLVPVVLPLLHGPADTRGRPTADQALESLQAAHQSDQDELRAWRSVLPAATTAGAAVLGL